MYVVIGFCYDTHVVDSYTDGFEYASTSFYSENAYGPFSTEQEAIDWEKEHSKDLYHLDRTFVVRMKDPTDDD